MRERIVNYLKSFGCFEIKHSGRSLGDHLIGTYDILVQVNAPEYVQVAGAIHSIYGTNVFTTGTFLESERDAVSSIFGIRAEYLAYLFCRAVRPSGLETGILFDKKTGLKIDITPDDLQELRIIEAANLLEQNDRTENYDNIYSAFISLASPLLGAGQNNSRGRDAALTWSDSQ